MKKIRSIYLDTSVISALFDDRTPERKRFTEEFLGKLENYRVCISTVVKEEITAASEEPREKMMDIIGGFEILGVTVEVKELAEEYIKKGDLSRTIQKRCHSCCCSCGERYRVPDQLEFQTLGQG